MRDGQYVWGPLGAGLDLANEFGKLKGCLSATLIYLALRLALCLGWWVQGVLTMVSTVGRYSRSHQ